MDQIARLWSKVDKGGPVPAHRPELGPCWLWTDKPEKQSGYGRISWKEGSKHRARKAHHIVWLVVRGELPPNIGHGLDDVVTDHLCRVRLCVNPDHIEWITHRENIERGTVGHHNRSKDACPSEHAYTPENTRLKVIKGGYTVRVCRTCERLGSQRRREKAA